MKHLVILLHADPVVRQRYEAALAKLDEPTSLLIVNSPHKGLSAAYKRLAYELRARSRGTLLEELVRYGGGLEIDKYATLTVASFSAGYAMVRELLWDEPSYQAIDAVVGIDSWHSAKDPDGTPVDAQLGGLVRFALRAVEGPYVCWLGHTDVRTYGQVASTTEVADEVLRLAGYGRPGAGGLRVKAEDRARVPRREHSLALTDWGDEWLADAVAELIARRAELGITTRETLIQHPDEPLGIRAVKLSRSEQLADVREVVGPHHHPRILEYFRGCVRDGHNIGLALQADEYPWCAAAASWAAIQSREAGEKVPHRWRAAVRELWADALEHGAARSAEQVRHGGYEPKPGDLCILTRGGPVRPGPDPFAATAGKGHVGRITVWRGDGRFKTLDGNVGNKWTDVDRDVMARELVGFIDYGGEPRTPDDDALSGMRWLDAAKYIYSMGRPLHPSGMDVLDEFVRRHGAELQP